MAVITAYGSAENAVAALKAGAFDYVSKPVGLEQLRALVKSALSLPDNTSLRERRRQLLGKAPRSCMCATSSPSSPAPKRRSTSPASRAAARSSPRA